MPEHPKARRAVDGLRSAANEFRIAATRASHTATKECAELDAKACDDAADLIAVLDTEIFRLRQAIGCYLDGRLERHELRSISHSWNNQ